MRCGVFDVRVLKRLLDGLPDSYVEVVGYMDQVSGMDEAELYWDICIKVLSDDVKSDFILSLVGLMRKQPVLFPKVYGYLIKNLKRSFVETLLGNVGFMDFLLSNDVVRQMKINFEYSDIVSFNSHFKKPTYFLGDTLSVMRDYVPDSSVNLIFTSPPYFNARDYSQYSSLDEYLDFIQSVFHECFRVLEDGRFLIVNVSPVICSVPNGDSLRIPLHFEFHRLFVEAGFSFVDEIIWKKPDASVCNRVGNYLKSRVSCSYKTNPVTESILVYRKNVGRSTSSVIRGRAGDFGNFEVDRTNVWEIQPCSDVIHTAVFPELLCEKVLRYYSFEGDVVMDIFGGSGTFGRVAHRMGRLPVLIERDREYFNWGRHLTPFYYDLRVCDVKD